MGDDLFVTNSRILKRGIEEKAANSILIKIKPDRLDHGNARDDGFSQALALQYRGLAPLGRDGGYLPRRSGGRHRCRLGQNGVPPRGGERMAKYNQLLRIEEELGEKARFNGLQSLGMKF